MADNEVVTELTADASGTTDGTDQFAVSMQKVELVLEQMLGVLTETRAEAAREESACCQR